MSFIVGDLVSRNPDYLTEAFPHAPSWSIENMAEFLGIVTEVKGRDVKVQWKDWKNGEHTQVWSKAGPLSYKSWQLDLRNRRSPANVSDNPCISDVIDNDDEEFVLMVA